MRSLPLTVSLDDTREPMWSTRYNLVLVNRVLHVDGSCGLKLILSLKHDPSLADVPVMLVSNHANAQEAASDLGASPGFGKASLHLAATLTRFKALLGE